MEEASDDSDTTTRILRFTAANAYVIGSWPSDATLTGAATFRFGGTDLAGRLLVDMSNLGTVAAAAEPKLRDAVEAAIDDDFRTVVLGDASDEALGTFTQVAFGLESSADDRFSVNGNLLTLSVAQDASYTSDTSTTNDAKLYRAAAERAWLRFGNGWEVEIESLTTRYLSQNRAQYQLTVRTIAGGAPGVNQATSATIVGAHVKRGQLTTVAFRTNVAGSADRYARTTGSGDMTLSAAVTTIATTTTEAGNKGLATEHAIRSAVDAVLPAAPATDGTYKLRLTKSGSTVTLSWVDDS